MVEFGIACSPTFTHERIVNLVHAWENAHIQHVVVPDLKLARDPFCVLTLCANETKSMKLGIMAADPYVRHPALTASSIGTVNEFSGGRASLWMAVGLGGHNEMGIKRTKPTLAMREAVQIMRGLLNGETVNVKGQVLNFSNGRLYFKSKHYTPIYIVSRSPRMLELAGEIADGVVIGSLASDTGIRFAKEYVKKGAERAGRKIEDIKFLAWVSFSTNEDQQRAYHDVMGGISGKLWAGGENFLNFAGIHIPPPLLNIVRTQPYNEDVEAEVTKQLASFPEFTREAISHFAIAGTPKECSEKLRALAQAGVDTIVLNPVAPGRKIEETVDLFIHQVMPNV